MKIIIVLVISLIIGFAGVSTAASPEEDLPCLTPDGRYAYFDVEITEVGRVVKFVDQYGDLVVHVYSWLKLVSDEKYDYNLCAWNN